MKAGGRADGKEAAAHPRKFEKSEKRVLTRTRFSANIDKLSEIPAAFSN